MMELCSAEHLGSALVLLLLALALLLVLREDGGCQLLRFRCRRLLGTAEHLGSERELLKLLIHTIHRVRSELETGSKRIETAREAGAAAGQRGISRLAEFWQGRASPSGREHPDVARRSEQHGDAPTAAPCLQLGTPGRMPR